MNLSNTLGLDNREFVSFVGAGGKKTAMQRLRTEGNEQERLSLYTTTTHMPPSPDIPLVVGSAEECTAELLTREESLAVAKRWISNPRRVEKKVQGFDAETVDHFFEYDLVDWLLVKADGARRREFKAPGPAEPVIPLKTTLVVVVASMQAVGEPVSSPTVHRPGRVAAIGGIDEGDRLTPAVAGKVLASTRGGCKQLPDTARAIVLLNKADTAEQRELARTVLRSTFEHTDRFSLGVISSFRQNTLDSVEP